MAAEPCPNEHLRAESNVNPATAQQYSTQLPNCRAYELVSPPETDGLEFPILSEYVDHHAPFIITERGDVFADSQATPSNTGAESNGDNIGVFRSVRGASGWKTIDMLPSAQPYGVIVEKVSANGSAALVETAMSLNPEDLDNLEGNPTSGGDLYVVEANKTPPLFVTHGELSDVDAQGDVTVYQTGEVFANPELTAVGFVLSHTDQPLSPADPGTATNCYIWADARDMLAGLTNPASGAEPNCRFYAVAADGRPIIEATNDGQIYAVDPSGNGAGTRQLSGPTPRAASFDAISENGETVYLTTTDKLTPEADTDTGADLYAVSVEGPPAPPTDTCVSCGHNGGGPVWLGQSADGSHVFFETSEGLWIWSRSTGAVKLAPASDGLKNLVFSHNGRYAIATTSVALSPADTNGTSDIYLFSEGGAARLITSGTASAQYRPVAVSDSGQDVVYEVGEGASGVVDESVDGQTGRISPLGSSYGYSAMGTAGGELEDVFFEAHEALVPADLNGGATDIYDARVDGGFPAPSEPASESTTPNPVAPGIAAYTGDLTPPSTQLAALSADTSHPTSTSKPKSLTRAQKLAQALKGCRRDKSTARRRCEKSARKRHGARAKVKRATRRARG